MVQHRKSRCLHFATISLVAMLLPEVLFAQDLEDEISRMGARGFFAASFGLMDVNKLNDELEDNGYRTIGSDYVSLGGGGFGLINRIAIGGEGHGILKKERSNSDFETTIDGGYGLFNIGYLVYSRRKFEVIPMIGIGGGSLDLKLNENNSFSFDSIMSNPRRAIKVSSKEFLLNAQVIFNYALGNMEDAYGERSLILGVNIGYMIAPGQANWETEWTDVEGGPDAGVNGFYIRITIGAGGYGFL